MLPPRIMKTAENVNTRDKTILPWKSFSLPQKMPNINICLCFYYFQQWDPTMVIGVENKERWNAAFCTGPKVPNTMMKPTNQFQ